MGGGKANTPAGATLLMEINACAMGEGGHGGSPNAEARKTHQQEYKKPPALR